MNSAAAAALAYLALSLALTWPLALGLARDVPADLGDSLLNMWILAWGAEHLPRVIGGTMSWAEFWNANIFHPEPMSLALSEHLLGQTLQILPVYWLTGNIILCYNLLFVSTFALSGLGAYLLVRDLTGSARAAFIAGLIYGFLPYRIASMPHLQVLSSQWMPFALWGFNRFVSLTGRRPQDTTRANAGLAFGVGALVLQNWSCVYFLLYFAPFVPLFVLHRMWTLGALGSARAWLGLTGAAAVTLAFTLPLVSPYQRVQQLFGIERPLGEVVNFSATLWSYLTASEQVRLWGGILRFHTRPEGETFLGFVPWGLAAAAVVMLLTNTTAAAVNRPRRRWLTIVLTIVAALQFVALVLALMFGGFLVEGLAVPIEINRTWNVHEATPPPRVYSADARSRRGPGEGGPPAVYQRIAALPQGSVITEFPFGDGAWEIRYVFYSASHWKPITNGYSGGFPPGYRLRVARLQRVAADPRAAWQSLRDSRTTHVVLHRNAFARSEDAAVVDAWLRSSGAVELERFADGDILFRLNRI